MKDIDQHRAMFKLFYTFLRRGIMIHTQVPEYKKLLEAAKDCAIENLESQIESLERYEQEKGDYVLIKYGLGKIGVQEDA